MTERINFKELINKYGAKKAAEIIRTTYTPLTEDFAKSHKEMNTFSNEVTDIIIKELEDEKEIETTTKNIIQPSIPLSVFSTTQNHTIEYAEETIHV